MLRLGVITDVHSDAAGTAEWHNRYDQPGTIARLRAALDLFGDAGVDALAVLGDLTDSGRPEAFTPVIDLLAGWSGPLVVLPGNHDAQEPGAFDAAVAPLSPATALPGVAVHTIGLHGRWPGRLRPDLGGAGGREGLPIVAGHHPVLSQRAATARAGLKYAGDIASRAGLEASVRALGGPVVVLCGHLHVRAAEASGGLLQLAFASLIEYPFEVGVLELDGLRVRRRCLPVDPHPPGHGADPVLAPADRTWAFESGAWRELADPSYVR